MRTVSTPVPTTRHRAIPALFLLLFPFTLTLLLAAVDSALPIEPQFAANQARVRSTGDPQRSNLQETAEVLDGETEGMLSYLTSVPLRPLSERHPGSGKATFAAHTSRASVPSLRVVIHKGRQVLALYEGARLVKTYRVSLGLEPVGAKTEAGDRRTPEGEYFICNKSSSSSFHRFLGISYPGEVDAIRAFEDGLISLETRNTIMRSAREGKTPPWNTRLGGWVGIHGYPTEDNQKRWVSLLYPKPHNWTNGCVALWDSEIEELYEVLPNGTPVTILP